MFFFQEENLVKNFNFRPTFWFLVKIFEYNFELDFDQNFDFWVKFRFLTKLSIVDQTFRFLIKMSIFVQKFRFLIKNFDFWSNIRFLTKLSIVDQSSRFLIEISIFDQNFKLLPKIQFLNIIYIFTRKIRSKKYYQRQPES